MQQNFEVYGYHDRVWHSLGLWFEWKCLNIEILNQIFLEHDFSFDDRVMYKIKY